jgi:hypothetical protein
MVGLTLPAIKMRTQVLDYQGDALFCQLGGLHEELG